MKTFKTSLQKNNLKKFHSTSLKYPKNYRFCQELTFFFILSNKDYHLGELLNGLLKPCAANIDSSTVANAHIWLTRHFIDVTAHASCNISYVGTI